MLDKLRFQKSALFLAPKKKPSSRRSIVEALNKCSAHRTGRALETVIRKELRVGGRSGQLSYTVFKISREPSFFRGSGLKDVLHGFIAFVEVGEICAVFSSHALEPWRHLARDFNKLEHPVLTKLFVDEKTAYESMTIDNASISRHSIRSKRVEADDLRNSLPLTSAGNSIPNNLRLRHDDNVFRISSRGSRIAKRDPPSELEELVQFCISVEEQIALPRPADLFIDNFSEPVSLEDIPKNVAPTGVLIPMFEIGQMFDRGEIRSISAGRSRDTRTPLSSANHSRLVHQLSRPMEVRLDGSRHALFQETKSGGRYRTSSSGSVIFNKKSISIRGGIFAALWLEMENGDVQKLESLLNREKSFIVTFSDAIHAYYNGRVFRNKGILINADFLLGIIAPEPALTSATTEKGHFVSGQSSFDANSVFAITEAHLCTGDPVIVCDDLGVEWADFIAVNSKASPPHISFFHCKHGALSLSASDFHIVVSQALKNLGVLSGSGNAISAKVRSTWSKNYKAEKIRTRITRLRRGTSTEAEAHIADALLSINCNRRMVLVVSFLSLKDLKSAIIALRAGHATLPQIPQMLWLLMSFVSACRDAGVEPRIVSQP